MCNTENPTAINFYLHILETGNRRSCDKDKVMSQNVGWIWGKIKEISHFYYKNFKTIN